jgi:molybdopterin-biosynthesis enzyme MoeA-like protein
MTGDSKVAVTAQGSVNATSPPARVIMPTANSASEVVTAALLMIGGKILSGRTKDQNIGYIAEYLTALGIDLKEVRVVGDEESAIVDALTGLRHRYSYVFTTGGIGPTGSDITAACVAKAFGVPIDIDPRALAILHEWVKTTGAEINEARLRMTRIPKGADLILNKVSGAPGFWIDNVIVMAGVPSIMQAMLDEVSPKLKTEVRMLSETVRADAREGDIGMQLGEIAKSNPDVVIGSYRSSICHMGPTPMWCCTPAGPFVAGTKMESKMPQARTSPRAVSDQRTTKGMSRLRRG